MQNLEWLKENAFQDIDKDWWISEEDYSNFDTHSLEANYRTQELLYSPAVGQLMSEIEYTVESQESNIDWAIKEIYTQETHPEYFL